MDPKAIVNQLVEGCLLLNSDDKASLQSLIDICLQLAAALKTSDKPELESKALALKDIAEKIFTLKGQAKKNLIISFAKSVEEMQLAVNLPVGVDESLISEFLSSCPGTLDRIQALLLSFEKTKNAALLIEIKGDLHNLKGECGVLGFTEASGVCHDAETYLDQKQAELIVDDVLAICDWLRQFFNWVHRGGKRDFEQGSELISRVLSEKKDKAPVVKPVELVDKDLLAEYATECLEHLANAEKWVMALETNPSNEDHLNGVFRSFHTVKGSSGMLNLQDILLLAHESESLLDLARKGKIKFEGVVVDVTLEAIDKLKSRMNDVHAALSKDCILHPDLTVDQVVMRVRNAAVGVNLGPVSHPKANPNPIGEILLDQQKITPDQLARALEKQIADNEKKIGEILVQSELVAPKDVVHALREQKGEAVPKAEMKVRESIKVDTERLDLLVDTIGELVIAQSMVSRDLHSMGLACERQIRHLRHLERISKDLQSISLSLRMVPLRATFEKMARLVRDLSKKTDKKIRFAMSGEDTELDKNVIEKIGDPLIHMIRNSCDHGIEKNSQRRSDGKPEEGTVTLSAYHKGGRVYIEIADDGKGLDTEVILAKAIEKKLIREDQKLEQKEIYNLIFLPGFSTAKEISDVSGRGVGMDVVKRNVEELRGEIEIESKKGQGTTFRISLPLTLAIIEGVVVRMGSETGIIPRLSILEFLKSKKEDVSKAFDQAETLNLRGSLIPVHRLGKIFSSQDQDEEVSGELMLVIVESNGRRAALVVDEIMEQQQTVIKPLGMMFQDTVGLSGATIMPDGTVGLILDVTGILGLAVK